MKLHHDFEMAVGTILMLGKRNSTAYLQTAEIARRLNVSLGYLQKVIQLLGMHGILDCKRGRIGGVRLGAKVITLLDVWKVTSGEVDLANPPVALMAKPLKTFADAMDKTILYKKK